MDAEKAHEEIFPSAVSLRSRTGLCYLHPPTGTAPLPAPSVLPCRLRARRGWLSLAAAGPGNSARRRFLISTRSLGHSVHGIELPSTVPAKDMLRNNIWDRTG